MEFYKKKKMKKQQQNKTHTHNTLLLGHSEQIGAMLYKP